MALIPAIIFLILEPYKNNKLVRFHSLQSIFFFVAGTVLSIAAIPISLILALVPFLGPLLSGLVWAIIYLGLPIIWLITVIKVYQGERYKLPVIGDLAEKQV